MQHSKILALLLTAACATSVHASDLRDAQATLPAASAERATLLGPWWAQMLQPLRRLIVPAEGCIPSEVDAVQSANSRRAGLPQLDDCGVQDPQ